MFESQPTKTVDCRATVVTAPQTLESLSLCIGLEYTKLLELPLAVAGLQCGPAGQKLSGDAGSGCSITVILLT